MQTLFFYAKINSHMAKKNKNSNKKNTRGKEDFDDFGEEKSFMKNETKNSIVGIICFVIGLFLFMSAFGMTGMAGRFVYTNLEYLFGYGYSLLPIAFMITGYSFTKAIYPNMGWIKLATAVFFILSGLGMMDIAVPDKSSGGVLGEMMASPLVYLFDIYASILFLGAILLISLLIMFEARFAPKEFFVKLLNIFKKKENTDLSPAVEIEIPETKEETKTEDTEEKEESTKEKIKKALGVNKKIDKDEELDINIHSKKGGLFTYTPPPLTLLEVDKGKPNVGDIKANANIIKRTLAHFNIEVEMDEITVGPTVTRYALKPAQGMKVSRILGLQNDLALALAAHPLRIEAPIPGKSLVGIEIPNKSKATVGLATLLSDESFRNSPKPLTIALGRGISGKAVVANLAKMPHALIAGTTGSGKSVTIHSIITSLLYKNGPESLKLIMIDPKRVELTLYNKIPHLLTPVITDAKNAILALKWAAKEMDRRYDILGKEAVRDIESYHNNILSKIQKNKGETEEAIERMPYIVIIIDELADIMIAYPRELETAIVRLAQMSRAVGIHLILSTQRPEVNVITGLIKANVPARIALKVSSQIDSRTILDAGGAEKLLGAGDMLYSSGQSQPERLQSAFISENEVKDVVKYLADAYKDEILEEITLSGGSISADKSIFESSLDDDADDDLYEEARICVMEAGRASTSYLQRKLKVGYARAARLMDILEERGVVGPADGAKPREILEKIEKTETGENVI